MAMKIKTFDPQKGIYDFELDEIEASFHAHPTVEILYAEDGSIVLETENAKFEAVQLAIIDSNIVHKITSSIGKFRLVMIECSTSFLEKILYSFSIEMKGNIYLEKSAANKNQRKFTELLSAFQQYDTFPITSNEKIQTCLNYLNSPSCEYTEMMEILKSKTNLSASRLSHLFKEEIGISIKKYLVWSRLKNAFHLITAKEVNMYEAAFQSGFYDQAHLSKAFKQLLGLSPSKVYNSRMLQE